MVCLQVVLPELATLRIAAYEDSGSKPLLGHRVLPVVGLRPGYRHIVLRNESGQPMGLPTLFVYIKVRDYIPDGFSEFAEALCNPIKYQSELEKRAQQLSVFQDDDDVGDEEGTAVPGTPVAPGMPGLGPGAPTGSYTGSPSDKGSKDAGGTNGEVLPSPNRPTTEVTTPKRQNSLSHKPQLSAKPSEDKAMLDIPVSALETVNIECEDLDKLLNHKQIKEKRQKFEKELSELKKKHRKERQVLASGVDKKKKELVKQHSKLEKKISSTKSV